MTLFFSFVQVSTTVMANWTVTAVLLSVLTLFTSPASAELQFGVGDGLAIVGFVVIAIIATCALLGWIARKRAS